MKLTILSEAILDTIKNFFKGKSKKRTDQQGIIQNSMKWHDYYKENRKALVSDKEKT